MIEKLSSYLGFQRENEILKTENETLKASVDAEKVKFRALKEEICLNKLQDVLDDEGCTLQALPDGRFSVTFTE